MLSRTLNHKISFIPSENLQWSLKYPLQTSRELYTIAEQGLNGTVCCLTN
jgi:hypothetical protein